MRPRPETITTSGYFAGDTLFWITAEVRTNHDSDRYCVEVLMLHTKTGMAPLLNLSDRHRERILDAVWEAYREDGTDQDCLADHNAS